MSLEAQYSALVEEIAKRKKQVEAFENGEVPPFVIPAAYVVDFALPAAGDSGDQFTPLTNTYNRLPLMTSSVVIKQGALFYAKSIEVVFQATGTLSGETQAATVAVPAELRYFAADLEFKIRDTGSDREWQNDWLPLEMLLSGDLNGLVFGNGHACLTPGSELFVSLAGGINNNLVESALNLASITSFALKFTLGGFEVAYV